MALSFPQAVEKSPRSQAASTGVPTARFARFLSTDGTCVLLPSEHEVRAVSTFVL